MKSRNKGFTLIEVLVVVVIIGVLAAMIIPLLLPQPERANIAEAEQLMGVMRRAIVRHAHMTSSTYPVPLNTTNTLNWQSIGLVRPATLTKWMIACIGGAPNLLSDPATDCLATRLNIPPGTRYAGSTIRLPVFANSEYTCGGNYVFVEEADPTKGCTIK